MSQPPRAARLTLLAAAALAGAALPAALAAQGERVQRDAFVWEGAVPASGWLYLRNVNGDVQVARADGPRVRVTATKRANGRGDLASVRVVQQAAPDGGVVVCTLVADAGRCGADDYQSGRRGWWGGDGEGNVSVEYTVRVPAGVRVDLLTTNGNVEVRDAGAAVVARTTNGNVSASSAGGPVTARTTNGNVVARMASLGGAGDAQDLDFSTTNGSVRVEMPATLAADVSLATTNGSVSTDFPATVTGRVDPRRLNFRLGDGTRRVRARTTNGNVELRRAGGGE